jgi:hypothetical protein
LLKHADADCQFPTIGAVRRGFKPARGTDLKPLDYLRTGVAAQDATHGHPAGTRKLKCPEMT